MVSRMFQRASGSSKMSQARNVVRLLDLDDPMSSDCSDHLAVFSFSDSRMAKRSTDVMVKPAMSIKIPKV